LFCLGLFCVFFFFLFSSQVFPLVRASYIFLRRVLLLFLSWVSSYARTHTHRSVFIFFSISFSSSSSSSSIYQPMKGFLFPFVLPLLLIFYLSFSSLSPHLGPSWAHGHTHKHTTLLALLLLYSPFPPSFLPPSLFPSISVQPPVDSPSLQRFSLNHSPPHHYHRSLPHCSHYPPTTHWPQNSHRYYRYSPAPPSLPPSPSSSS